MRRPPEAAGAGGERPAAGPARARRTARLAAGWVALVACVRCAPAPPRDPRIEQEAYVEVVLAEAGIVAGGLDTARQALESPFARVRSRAALAVARLDPGASPHGVRAASPEDPADAARNAVLDEGRVALAATAADPGAGAALASRLAARLPGERDERARWAIAWVLSRLPHAAADPAVGEALAALAFNGNFLASARAWEGLARAPPPRGLDLRRAAADAGGYWIARQAACRAFAAWLARGQVPPDHVHAVEAAVRACGPLADPIELDFPPLPAPPRVALDAGLLRALVPLNLRNPRAILRVTGRGEIVVEVLSFEAPLHALDFAARVIAGEWRGRAIDAVDPLTGVLVRPRQDAPALPREPVEREVLRGGVISPGELAGGLLIAHLPLPELAGKSCPWGRVALGMEVVDRIRPGDFIAEIVLLDSAGRPIEPAR